MTKGRQVYKKISTKENAENAVFFDEVSCYWLTGFHSTDGAVVTGPADTSLFVDSRYYEAAQKARESGVLAEDTRVFLQNKGPLKAILENIAPCRLAIDSTAVSLARFEQLKAALQGYDLVPVNNICGEFRMVKTPDELEKMKKAQAITDKAFTHILGFIKEGVTERELAAEIEYFVKRNGGDGMAFDTIAVSGKNSSLPHGVPGKDKLTKNSFITMDFGAKYKGYCSDMTRTVVLGKADAAMKKVYFTVLKAQEAAIDAARGNVLGKEMDAIARDIIEEAGYGPYFGHSLGHSLGIEIHEMPNFAPRSENLVPAGAVMTVEPGIYLEGKYGVRIEDMVYLTKDGYENLTSSPKDLIEL